MRFPQEEEDILFDTVNRNLMMFDKMLKVLQECFDEETAEWMSIYLVVQTAWNEVCKNSNEYITMNQRMARKLISMNQAINGWARHNSEKR